jgi:hypothetical protein
MSSVVLLASDHHVTQLGERLHSAILKSLIINFIVKVSQNYGAMKNILEATGFKHTY